MEVGNCFESSRLLKFVLLGKRPARLCGKTARKMVDGGLNVDTE